MSKKFSLKCFEQLDDTEHEITYTSSDYSWNFQHSNCFAVHSDCMPTSVWRQWLTPRLLNWTAKGFIRLSPRNLAPNLCSLLFFFYCVVLYDDVQYIILAISENAKAYCFLKNEEMLKQSSQDLYFFTMIHMDRASEDFQVTKHCWEHVTEFFYYLFLISVFPIQLH